MSLLNFQIKYLIFLIPLFVSGSFFLYWGYLKNKQFNNSPLAQMRNYKYSSVLFKLKYLFLFFSLIFLLVSVLRPAWGVADKTIEAKGSDIVFTLDVSKSMKALDLNEGAGTVDRLTMAKKMISDFVNKYPQNRYGLVIFAGEAFVSSPLTIDHSAFLTFLNGVDYNDVSKQGTDLTEALKASIDRFYGEQDKERGRSVVLISDGGEDAKVDVQDFAEVVKKLNIQIFTVGVGNTKGVPIPDSQDLFGRIQYKRYKGKMVETKLNEKVLKNIASATGGEYFHAKKKSDLEKIAEKIAKAKTTVIKLDQKAGQKDQYQIFLFFSFVFFISYLFLEPEKIKFLEKYKTITKNYLKFFVLIFALFSLSACSNNDFSFRYHLQKGNKDFANNYFKEAKNEYIQAGEASRKQKYIANNNLALANLASENYLNAQKKLEETTAIYCQKEKREFCDQLYYNLGESYYRLGEAQNDKKEQKKLWKQAIKSYESDLKLNPDDKEAEENIEFIKNKLKETEEKNSQGEGENNEENNNEQGQSQDKSVQNNDSDKGGQGESQSKEGEQTQASKDGESDGQENKNNSTEKGDSSQSRKGEIGKEGEQAGQKEGDQEGVGAGSKENKESSLDKQTSTKVDQYLKDLEQQENSNQKYFQPNPNAQNNNDSFDDFFGDPFFDEFFGGSGGAFGSGGDENEIDW